MKGPKPKAKSARESIVKIDIVKIPGRALRVLSPRGEVGDVDGAIVWVQPVLGDTPEQVSTFVAKVREAGAVRVVPLPRPTEAAAVPASVVETPTRANENLRVIVEELLSEVTEQPEMVRQIVEQAMSEAGL